MNVKKADFLGEEPTYKKGGIIMFDKMKLKMKKVMKNEKGMTLIELLAVIVIIAIIALIAVPAIGNIINNSKDKAILADAQTVLAGAKIAISEGACGNPAGATITCNTATLQDYVDGVTLTEGDQVIKTTGSPSSYSITYAKIAGIKNAKFKAGVTSDKTITDKKLAENMGNKE